MFVLIVVRQLSSILIKCFNSFSELLILTDIITCINTNIRTPLNSHFLFAGTTPGPILLGSIIDSSCSVWQDNCGQTGSCWTYRKYELGIKLLVWWAAIKALGVIFFIIAYKVYKPPPEEENFSRIENRDQPAISTVTQNNIYTTSDDQGNSTKL